MASFLTLVEEDRFKLNISSSSSSSLKSVIVSISLFDVALPDGLVIFLALLLDEEKNDKISSFSLGLEEDDACGSFEASFLTTGLAEILFFSFGSTLTFYYLAGLW